MAKIKITDRIAARHKTRIDALAQAIREDGFDAAIKYAESILEGDGSTAHDFRKTAAIAMAALTPDDPALWDNHNVNTILRKVCAEAIANAEALSAPLRKFAAAALLKPIPAKRKGRPSDQWQRILVCAVLEDLKLAGIPVYHGDGQDTDAPFYAVDAVATVLGNKERTIRAWWQQRAKVLGSIKSNI